MSNNPKFYINGHWVEPIQATPFDVINPATEEVVSRTSLGSPADVDCAVQAARAAFPSFSRTSVRERIELLTNILSEYERRIDEISTAVMTEMGSPIAFSRRMQAPTAVGHLRRAIAVLQEFKFEYPMGTTRVHREPIGVCGFITPWNWPINQIMAKLPNALAAGCTVVVKPSEYSPLSAIILAEVLHAAGVPPGVFNLVNGDGPTVGHAISAHPDVDMISFTGSTVAGIQVARDAAASVKRVHQELGGKSPNILLPGRHLSQSVPAGLLRAYTNCGQSCQAPTRMLVHESQLELAVSLIKSTSESIVVGDPRDERTTHGPLVNSRQFERVCRLIQTGLDEGGRLIIGGPGRPTGLTHGYFIRPTAFVVTPEMTLAKEEVFGPVLAVLAYRDEDHAIEIANDTPYGLAGYVFADDIEEARRVGKRIRAGRIYLNNGPRDEAIDYEAPFGGYKRSGNGREVGALGLEEFLEIKAVIV